MNLTHALILLLVTWICFAPTSASCLNSYQVGEAIEGETYSEATKAWNKRELSLWVGIDSSGEEFVLFSAEGGIGEVNVWMPYASGEVAKIEKLLIKATEWINIARSNRVDTSKVLGCFPDAQYLICERDGTPHGRRQLGIRFFAINDGQTSGVIFDMADGDNQFRRATIQFGPTEIEKLLQSLHKVEHTFKKARDMAKKQDLFTAP